MGARHDIGAYEYVGSVCPPDLDLAGTQLANVYNESDSYITSTEMINSPAQVDYNATTEINLLSTFEVKLGAEFHAYILGCVSKYVLELIFCSF